MAYVNVKEASKRLNISLRAIQRRCKKLGLKKDANGYLIPEETYRKWLLNDTPATHQTTSVATPTTNDTTTATPENDDDDDGTIIQQYTIEQYERLEAILINRPKEKEVLMELDTNNLILQERTNQQQQRINELNEHLKLANHRIEVLINSIGDQTKSILQRNTIEFIDKSKPDK